MNPAGVTLRHGSPSTCFDDLRELIALGHRKPRSMETMEEGREKAKCRGQDSKRQELRRGRADGTGLGKRSKTPVAVSEAKFDPLLGVTNSLRRCAHFYELLSCRVKR